MKFRIFCQIQDTIPEETIEFDSCINNKSHCGYFCSEKAAFKMLDKSYGKYAFTMNGGVYIIRRVK